MTMMRWEPYRDMMSLRNAMDRLFEDSFIRPYRFWPEISSGDLSLELDMYQTDKDVVIKTAIPGLKPEEVDISVTGNVLTIKGEHKEEQEIKEEDYLRKERRHGTFHRSLQMPVAVKSEQAEAVFDNGVLTLILPKAELAKPKQIKVKAKSVNESGKK